MRVLIVGAGPAGHVAHMELPDAGLVARPGATAWHAEAGLLWTLADGAIRREPWDALLVCADEPLLLTALGCEFAGLRPVVDRNGRTTVPGVFAAGRVLGARTAEEAASQGRTAARACMDLPVEGPSVEVHPASPSPVLPDGKLLCPCMDVTVGEVRAHAHLGAEGVVQMLSLHAGACRMARCRPLLGAVVHDSPARPVPLAALAALAGPPPETRPLQQDTEGLG